MILCCGEALIDMIPAPTEGGEGFVPHAGGAIFNTAIALGRLGQDVSMATGLSLDLFGQQLIDGLSASGVGTSMVVHSDRPTTLAFVKLVDGHARYQFYDEASAGRMLRYEDFASVPQDVKALFFGGISLACEPGADAYAALCEAEAAGRLVMMDPNIRPGFIQDEARYRARLSRMLACADIVKVSDEDLDWILPEHSGIEAQAAGMQAMGPKVVVVTRGKEGATAFLADGTQVSVPSERAEVVDTVGAGDTFNAGVLAKLSQMGLLSKLAAQGIAPAQMQEVLAHGAKVAAVTVSRAGANPPWAHEL
ncbi:carbohydrate kinase family protein [Cognatishimia activa]|uniref:Carbohydrate kinase n=1 Tax=Cognatishimia activa TaxID=1715691 RepID=A0A975I8F4_9RHOB|nr:carbohydrate kinase [Cognatishimia activa]QTN37002.1 carbohydrate kinase [Cognatishimia activa]